MSDLATLVRRYFRAQNLTNIENGLTAVGLTTPGKRAAFDQFLEIEDQLKEAVAFVPNPYWESIAKRMIEYARGYTARSQIGSEMGLEFVRTHHPASYIEWREIGEDWIENETEPEATQIA